MRIVDEEQLRQILPPPRESTQSKVLDHLDEQGLEFLAASPFLLLATAGKDGAIEVSPKGDEPGFVQAEDPRTVLIPDRSGNNLAFGLTNILHNPHVGAIALLPATGETLRFSGQAEILADPALLERLSMRGRPALLAIRIRISHAYFHCAKSVLRSSLWQPEKWPAPKKISFGRIIGKKIGADEKTRQQIDAMVADAYRKPL
ncbi:MAG: MSMEG_1061 family FMN-dependent PPOX-type flavoprotein [Rhodospirillales bacterium]